MLPAIDAAISPIAIFHQLIAPFRRHAAIFISEARSARCADACAARARAERRYAAFAICFRQMLSLPPPGATDALAMPVRDDMPLTPAAALFCHRRAAMRATRATPCVDAATPMLTLPILPMPPICHYADSAADAAAMPDIAICRLFRCRDTPLCSAPRC